MHGKPDASGDFEDKRKSQEPMKSFCRSIQKVQSTDLCQPGRKSGGGHNVLHTIDHVLYLLLCHGGIKGERNDSRIELHRPGIKAAVEAGATCIVGMQRNGNEMHT